MNSAVGLAGQVIVFDRLRDEKSMGDLLPEAMGLRQNLQDSELSELLDTIANRVQQRKNLDP